MRVGIVCFSHHGGSGVLATELGFLLSRRGHDIHLISNQPPFRMSQDQDGLRYHQVIVHDHPAFPEPPFEAALASTIYKVASEQKLDVVHAHYVLPHVLGAFLATQMLNPRPALVATLHGTDITLMAKDYLGSITGYLLSRCDAVTAVSDSLSAQATDIFGKSLNIKKIYNFVDSKKFYPPFVRSNKDPLIILHVSNFRPVKQIGKVLEIFSIVTMNVPCKLIMVGDGPDLEMAREFAFRHKIHESVEFLGRRHDVPELMRGASLLLLPSREESFGLTALEAMACGVPVVGTTAGGIPEVVLHGVTGYLSEIGDVVEMADNALRLLTDRELHAEFVANCLERAESLFKEESIAEQYEGVYRQAINNINRRRDAMSAPSPSQLGLSSISG